MSSAKQDRTKIYQCHRTDLNFSIRDSPCQTQSFSVQAYALQSADIFTFARNALLAIFLFSTFTNLHGKSSISLYSVCNFCFAVCYFVAVFFECLDFRFSGFSCSYRFIGLCQFVCVHFLSQNRMTKLVLVSLAIFCVAGVCACCCSRLFMVCSRRIALH